MPHEQHEANRLSWNAATAAHNTHKADQAAFLKGGGSTLKPEELGLLGDIRGKSLLHLQCNAGQDTLSLVHHGATVTGIDISDEAIGFAQQLSQESGLPGTFIRSDVYDWLEAAPADQFDVVFASYGALCWLSDLQRYFRGVRRVLKPGGRYVIVEFHPAMALLETRPGEMYPYSCEGQAMFWDDGVNDYVALSEGELSPSGHREGIKEFVNPHGCYEWEWGIADVLTALIDSGLRLTQFKEWPYSNGCKMYDFMVPREGNRWSMPDGVPYRPFMYGLEAVAG